MWSHPVHGVWVTLDQKSTSSGIAEGKNRGVGEGTTPVTTAYYPDAGKYRNNLKKKKKKKNGKKRG